MKRLRIFGALIALCLISMLSSPVNSQAYEDTECFKCHTSAKKLIGITREIAKTRPAVSSAESEGEG